MKRIDTLLKIPPESCRMALWLFAKALFIVTSLALAGCWQLRAPEDAGLVHDLKANSPYIAALHLVALPSDANPIWMSDHEVTVEEFLSIVPGLEWAVDDAPSGDVPVFVLWDLAHYFCLKLTEKATNEWGLPRGYVFRLPTYIEWTHASAAGGKGIYCFGNDLSLLSRYANYGANLPRNGPSVTECMYAIVQPVRNRKPNAWGLYDMHGNAEEWVIEQLHDGRRVYNIACGGNAASAANQVTSHSFSFTGVAGFRVVLAEGNYASLSEEYNIPTVPWEWENMRLEDVVDEDVFDMY